MRGNGGAQTRFTRFGRLTLGAGAACLAACHPGSRGAADVEPAATAHRQVAITIDDLPVTSRTRSDSAFQAAVTEGILAALAAHRAPAVGFVNEQKLERNGVVDPARVELLRRWLRSGHELGNHTYSHADLHGVASDSFLREIRLGERVTRGLVAEMAGSLRWFRHPYLHTGRDSTMRAAVERFLSEHGYRVAPVTVDNADYQYAAAFDRTADRGDAEMAMAIRASYLAYMEEVVRYYEAQARTFLGREIPQILLLHANALNAAALDDLLTNLERSGYVFVSLEEALRDPAHGLPDGYFGAGGITWLHRWALTAGHRGAVFAGEPEVPDWVVEAASR